MPNRNRAAKQKPNAESGSTKQANEPLVSQQQVVDDVSIADDERDDALDIHLDMDDWLSNQIERDAQHKKRRNDRRYGGTDMCIVGLERIVSVVTGDDFADLPLTTIESQLKMVDMYQEKFYEQCVGTTKNATAEEMRDRTEIMNKVDKMVKWLQMVLFQRKRQLLTDESTDGTLSVSNVQNSTSTQISNAFQDVRVKKVEIEKFSGVQSKWPAFKSSFLDCFHNNASMSGGVKFYHLMAHLETDSEAYNTIGSMNRTDENYEAAWKTLCDTYDNERVIVDDIVQSFIDMPAMNTPSRTGFIAMLNKTNNLLYSLPKYNVKVEHWDPILVSLIVRKLDKASRKDWAEKRDQRAVAKLKPLLDFIRIRADSADVVCSDAFNDESKDFNHNQQNGSYQTKPVSSNGHFRGANGTQYLNASSSNSSDKYVHDPSKVRLRIVRCHHCNGLHKLYDCKEFSSMNPELKQGRLESLNVCIKCLRKGHTHDRCKKMRNCKW